jgi:glycosyltransferase involved in cell wall biosynthesis
MKKVLFISYFWPPSGKASLHWPLDIIRHFPQDEIQPIILTVKDETFTQKDESLLSKVNPNWKVIKSKALEPFDIYRKFIGKRKYDKLTASETISLENKNLTHRISIWIRMNLFVPDARVGWNFTAIKAAKNIFKKEKIDAIVSIGPPHSSHLIGLKLSKKYSIPHIPVLIDPWVDIIYYKNFKRNRLTLKLDNHFEKSVLQNAGKVVFVTKSTQEDYINKYPFLIGKSVVLYWGYDDSAFAGIKYQNKINDENVLVHAGNIFGYQNPKKLWDQIKIENETGKIIKIKFIGTVDSEILNYINNIGLSQSVENVGFLPYPQMIEQICNADMLLVCSSEPRHVPGKLFEAMKTGNPIVAFGNNNIEVKQILSDANAGMMFNYEENVEEFFRRNLTKNTDHKDLLKYDRSNISKEFTELLKSL